MKKIFDYLPFFVVALFATTLFFPKVFVQENHLLNFQRLNKPAIAQVIASSKPDRPSPH
ncbi:MAG: hypothetical protein HC763_09170 [Hydrococcus sp. CRU_1_1]|nr:hypothetical protein [Hydrococcus sp. CRU_1_1]